MAEEAERDITSSANESKRLLRDIEAHHDAAEAHADKAVELSESGSPFDVGPAIVEGAMADVENDQANAIADQLQAKIGPNHTVQGDGTIEYSTMAPGAAGLDMDRARLEDRLTASTGLSPEDIVLAGPGATQAAEQDLIAQDARDVEAARQRYVDGLVEEAGLDPATATPEQIHDVVVKEGHRQSGVLDLIKGKGIDPDALTPEELEKIAEEVVSEREAELEKLQGGDPIDGPLPIPGDAEFDGPEPKNPDEGGDDDEPADGIFDDTTPAGPGDRGDVDHGPDQGGGGPGPDSGPDGPAPGGGDPIDDAGSGAPQPKRDDETEPADDEEVIDLDEFDDLDSDYPIPELEGSFPTTDGGQVEGIAYRDGEGTWTVVADDGTIYEVTAEYAESLEEFAGSPAEDEPIEQFTAPNLHADDPTVAEMIHQEHEAKQNADIDYGDQDPIVDDVAYADIRPDQIDYGEGGAPPSGDPDVPIESPGAGVIDPSELDDPTPSGAGQSQDAPLDRLAAEQTGGSAASDDAAAADDTVPAFGTGADQPAAVDTDFGSGARRASATPIIDGDEADAADPAGNETVPSEPVPDPEPALESEPFIDDLVATEFAGHDADHGSVDDPATDDIDIVDE